MLRLQKKRAVLTRVHANAHRRREPGANMGGHQLALSTGHDMKPLARAVRRVSMSPSMADRIVSFRMARSPVSIPSKGENGVRETCHGRPRGACRSIRGLKA